MHYSPLNNAIIYPKTAKTHRKSTSKIEKQKWNTTPGMSFVESLRIYLAKFKMPGEVRFPPFSLWVSTENRKISPFFREFQQKTVEFTPFSCDFQQKM